MFWFLCIVIVHSGVHQHPWLCNVVVFLSASEPLLSCIQQKPADSWITNNIRDKTGRKSEIRRTYIGRITDLQRVWSRMLLMSWASRNSIPTYHQHLKSGQAVPSEAMNVNERLARKINMVICMNVSNEVSDMNAPITSSGKLGRFTPVCS